MNLPVYSCHKQVEAMKIAAIEPVMKGKKVVGLQLFPVEAGLPIVEVDLGYSSKHNPQLGGYYVRYKDGYESYSPAEEFEEGYIIEKDLPAPKDPSTSDKTLGNTDASGASINVKDIVFFGDGDTFRLICKASSQREGWMKSTKAMEIAGSGCVVQVTTQQRNPDGSYAVAEALTFVPGVKIFTDTNGHRSLVRV